MGSRKHNIAERRKEERSKIASARLNNCPTSPRKMRLVADLVRGTDVEQALRILKTTPKHPAGRLHKLLLSAIDNWVAKNEGTRIEESALFVKTIMVDCGRVLKRVQPAPQGRAHRVRKRSNHVTLVLGSRNDAKDKIQETENEAKEIKVS